ncbi:MAG: hypothetical protein ACK443_06965 [Methylococcaceae bacterium]|jgi:hypothetical protein
MSKIKNRVRPRYDQFLRNAVKLGHISEKEESISRDYFENLVLKKGRPRRLPEDRNPQIELGRKIFESGRTVEQFQLIHSGTESDRVMREALRAYRKISQK